MFKKPKTALKILGLLIICCGFIYYFYPQKTEITLASAQAQKRSLQIAINATGQVFAKDLVAVATLANGRINELRVHQGQQVREGDVIAVLDDERERNELKAAQERLEHLKASLNADAIAASTARKKLARAQKAAGSKSAEQLDALRSAAAAANAQLAGSRAALEAAKVNLSTLQKALDDTVVTAPISGTAIAVYATAGQTINSRTSSPVLLKIADLSELEVRMKVPQHEVGRLQIGQQIIASDLAGKEIARATLASIDEADTASIDGSASAAVQYYARYFLPQQPGLKIGMQLKNRVQIKQIEDALCLPINFVGKDEAGYFVWLKNGEEFERRGVELGENDEGFIQILSGLAEGDRVYLR